MPSSASLRPLDASRALGPPRQLDPSRRDGLALSLLPGVGPVAFRELVERYGDAARAWQRHPTGSIERTAARSAADLALAEANASGAEIMLLGDSEYPESLLDLAAPPSRLFSLGDRSLLDRRSVAFVGTRTPTPYGLRATRTIVFALARAGATVISGMALGIDGEAHTAALDGGGTTIAVLGTGVDRPYPWRHAALYTRIAREGLVVSEALPGERAVPGSFPRRNRLIAALARVIIVVEAGARSGALITAAHALELGRVIGALPGPYDAPKSAGTNELLRDGAVMIASVEDALALTGLSAPPRELPAFASESEESIWNALEEGGADLDSIVSRSAMPPAVCLAAITSLELAGMVECVATGEVRRRRGQS